VFDNAVARPNSVQRLPTQSFEQPRWLLPADAPDSFISQLYGQSFPQVNNYELLSVDVNGISKVSSSPTGHEFFYPKPARAAERMFTNTGGILDSSSGAMLGQVPGVGSGLAYAVVADAARGRLYVWTALDQREVIFVHDLATMTRLSIVPVYPNSGSPGGYLNKSMVLWGNDGLALTDGNRVIVLSGTVFTD
jgi:hypothetical protein